MSDEINVRLPDKLTVESPKTDQAIDALQAAFVGFSKMLQKSVVEIQHSLEALNELPTLVRNVETVVTHQFGSLFENLHRMAAAAHLSVMHACVKKRESAEQVLELRRTRLDGERERMTQRYSALLTDVSRDCERRIEQLDSHAFEIVEQAYPRQVQARFELDSLPAVKLLADHADESAMTRGLCLDERLDAALKALARVLLERDEIRLEVRAVTHEAGPPPGWYRVPTYFVEVENVITGARRLELAGPLSRSADLDADRLAHIVAEQAARGERRALSGEEAKELINSCSSDVDAESRAELLTQAHRGEIAWVGVASR